MSVIKSFFGAIVGAAAATGAYFAIENYTGETYIWFPIITGILTGLVASVFGGKSRGTSARFVCGAFAALIAGVAIFGIEFLPGEDQGEFGALPGRSTERVADGDRDADDSEKSEDGGSDEARNQGSDDDSADSGDDGADEEGADGEGGTGETSDEGDTPDPNEASRGRGEAPNVATPGDNAASERFAEIIKKKKHESWLNTWLPYVLSGIGILFAYQIARGFGSGTSGGAEE